MRHENPILLGFWTCTEARHKEALHCSLCCKFRLNATEAHFQKSGGQSQRAQDVQEKQTTVDLQWVPRVLLSILHPRASYRVFVLQQSMLYFYVLGTCSIFQALKHWHKCVCNPMWKSATGTELKDGEIYYQLSSACPWLLSPGVVHGAFKSTVLSYPHSHSTSPLPLIS